MYGEIIELNVGGVAYTTTKETLCCRLEPSSMLSAIVNSGLPSRRDANDRIFIDRDGQRFRHVLNYLRSGSFHCKNDPTALRELEEEAGFFRLENLLKRVRGELARIELEEDLGAMSSAIVAEKMSSQPASMSSPRSTQCFELVSSHNSVCSERDSSYSRKPVVRVLDCGMSTEDSAFLPSAPSANPKAKPVQAQVEHMFTLDADF